MRYYLTYKWDVHINKILSLITTHCTATNYLNKLISPPGRQWQIPTTLSANIYVRNYYSLCIFSYFYWDRRISSPYVTQIYIVNVYSQNSHTVLVSHFGTYTTHSFSIRCRVVLTQWMLCNILERKKKNCRALCVEREKKLSTEMYN